MMPDIEDVIYKIEIHEFEGRDDYLPELAALLTVEQLREALAANDRVHWNDEFLTCVQVELDRRAWWT